MTRALLAVIAALAACGSKAKKVTASATIVVELKPARALWYGASPPTITFPKIVTPGLVIGINNDQDSGSVDSSDNVVNGAADAAQMTSFIIKQRTATAVSGDRMHIVRKPGGGNVRVFRAGTGSTGILTTSTSLSTTSDADATAIMTALGTGDVELYVEGTSAGDVELCAAWTGSASDEQCAKFIVVDGYGAPTGYGPRIYGDTNRNGTLLASEDVAGHDKYTATTGAIAFPNIDKDCGSPDDAADTTIACAADEADIAHVRVDKPRMGTLPAGWKPVLRYVSSTQPRFHIFERATNGASELTGTWTTIDGVTFWQVDLSALSAWTAPGEMTLGLEGRALDVPADLPVDLFVCVTHVATMSDASCDRMQFRNSTALLQPNTETNVRVVVTDDPENVAMRNSMSSSMPASVALSAEAPGVNDQWFQDEIEILGIRAPRGGAQLVVQLPRYRGLSAWSSAQIGPNIANTSLKPTDLVGDSPQYGGNLECSPPSGADQGRIIIGDDMAPALVAGLRALAPLQSTIAISTRWLAVGHVDEVAAIFPKPGGGWGTTVGDPDAAKAILNGVQEKASLFWHCRTPTRTRAPECFGEGVTTSASAKTSGAPARLTANGFTFTRPSGREFQWLRIYKGRGQGQVARIITASTSAHRVDVDAVFKLPNVEWTRCLALFFALGDTRWCDPASPMPASDPDWVGNTWFEVPDSTSRFVIVEDSLSWAPLVGGLELPALVTAGELRDPTINALLWGANHTLVVSALTSVASALAGLPGGSTPVRVPVLYSVISSGGALVDRRGDSVLPNLTNYQVVTGPSGTKIFAPRTFGPSTGGADPFETAFIAKMAGASGTVTFVDDWDLYHRQVGEVHCGTNLFKASARKAWP